MLRSSNEAMRPWRTRPEPTEGCYEGCQTSNLLPPWWIATSTADKGIEVGDRRSVCCMDNLPPRA